MFGNVNVVVAIAWVILQVFPHEYGHVLIARHFNVRVKKVEFFTRRALKYGAAGMTETEKGPYQHLLWQKYYELVWLAVVVGVAVLILAA